MKIRYQAFALAVVTLLTGAACGRLQAKQAFKDGNKAYRDENFKKAIVSYEKAISLDPGMAEAYFYLGSAHQALYRPGKEIPGNKEHVDQAIANFKKSLELNDGSTDGRKTVKRNALAALTGVYSDDPFKDYGQAHSYAQQLVQESPNEPKNLFAMANLFEKFGKVDDAQATYEKAAEVNPNDPKACGALAAFYNKPLWEGRSKFDQAIDVLQRCANLDPKDPSGYQKVATFYWDKAYRDPLLEDAQKDQYADKGLEAVDRALGLKPDYVDAIIYKGLLYRVKAQVATNPRLRQQYLDEAQNLQKQGLELKKEQAAAAAAATPSPGGGQ